MERERERRGGRAARPSQPNVLLRRESCKLYLDARPDEPLAAHKHLAIRCGAAWPASVFFIDGAPELAADDGCGARAEQRLFVELVPRADGGSGRHGHPCVS